LEYVSMSPRKTALPLALAAVLAGTAGLSLPTIRDAMAQATTAPQQAQQPERHRFDPTRHIEGRIAFLKAELKITDAQAPQFEKVAQAMRESAKERAQTFQQLRGDRDKPQTALERLEMRARFDQMRTQQAERFLAAFRPLYQNLSDDQKKAADELLARPHHFHRR
jgi:LTXXQ motif family protein